MNFPSKAIAATLLITVGTLSACHSADTAHSAAVTGTPLLLNQQEWITRGGIATFTLSDGIITGTTAPNTINTFLCTPSEYADFILEVDFKTDAALNSGIQIRSHARPETHKTRPIERVHGYQIEIDPSERKWTGGLYDEGGRAWLADLKSNPAAQAAFKQGDWNHLRIHAEGSRIRTWINGVAAIDYTETAQVQQNRSGFIALQVHGVGAKTEPLQVQWKNLLLRPIEK